MVAQRINRQAQNLDIALVEFRLQTRDFRQFCCANRGVILGVGKEHPPLVAEIIIKRDISFGGLLGEVGDLVRAVGS